MDKTCTICGRPSPAAAMICGACRSSSFRSSNEPHVPNEVPRGVRLKNGMVSVALVCYGAFSLWRHDLSLPLGSRPSAYPRPGIHFQNTSLTLVIIAMAFAVIHLLVVILDHHDHKPNERVYRFLGQAAKVLGMAFFVLAYVLDLIVDGHR